MTLKEQIMKLQTYKMYEGEDIVYVERDDVLKALEQEPCEDAVSREAVLAIAGDSCLDLDSYEDTKEFCDEIKELPSVVHTQKTGRWIFVDNAHEHARCSECGYGSVDLFDGRPHNYCPNCGSLMMNNERTLEYIDQNTMMSAT